MLVVGKPIHILGISLSYLCFIWCEIWFPQDKMFDYHINNVNYPKY